MPQEVIISCPRCTPACTDPNRLAISPDTCGGARRPRRDPRERLARGSRSARNSGETFTFSGITPSGVGVSPASPVGEGLPPGTDVGASFGGSPAGGGGPAGARAAPHNPPRGRAGG